MFCASASRIAFYFSFGSFDYFFSQHFKYVFSGMLPERLLDNTVFERMIAQNYYPAPAVQQPGKILHEAVKVFQLLVYRYP